MIVRTAACPCLDAFHRLHRHRAASCGASKPIEFSASMTRGFSSGDARDGRSFLAIALAPLGQPGLGGSYLEVTRRF